MVKEILIGLRLDDTHYFFCLILKYEVLEQPVCRQSKIFKDMHRFIPGRLSSQCRTHHQKRMKNGSSLKEVLYRFYKENYTERLLDVNHLIRELNYFIDQSYEKGNIKLQ